MLLRTFSEVVRKMIGVPIQTLCTLRHQIRVCTYVAAISSWPVLSLSIEFVHPKRFEFGSEVIRIFTMIRRPRQQKKTKHHHYFNTPFLTFAGGRAYR